MSWKHKVKVQSPIANRREMRKEKKKSKENNAMTAAPAIVLLCWRALASVKVW